MKQILPISQDVKKPEAVVVDPNAKPQEAPAVTPEPVAPAVVTKTIEEIKPEKQKVDPSKPIVIKKKNGEAKIIMPKMKSDKVEKKEKEVE